VTKFIVAFHNLTNAPKDAGQTVQKTHCVYDTNSSPLILLTEIVAVICENHTEHKMQTFLMPQGDM
jgi:hypothetical protein